MISLGIGDPDLPSPDLLVEEARRWVGDAGDAPVPVEPRPRRRSARRWPASTGRRFGVELDPDREILPLLGGKEGVAHVCFAMLDPGDVCLAADPGYPVYTVGTAARRRRAAT